MKVLTEFTIKNLTVVGVLMISLTIAVYPQPAPKQESLSAVELKGKVPVNREPLKVNLPQAREVTLKNGLRVLLIENHQSPTFTIQMVVLSGGLSDSPNKRGQALMTAQLLREGTTTRSNREISEQIDALGSTLTANAGISSFTTNIVSSGLIESFDKTLDVFSDIILHPKFPPEEAEKFKSRLLAQVQLQRSGSSFMARQQLNRAIYADHPAALLFPPEDSLKKITADDLNRFHSTFYRPNNSFVAVLGDISMKELLPKLERAFGDWKRGDISSPVLTALQRPAQAKIYLIDRPGSVQTTLLLGNFGIKRTDPDYYALQVMNQILGGDPSSRLFNNLREVKGYTYGASSSFDGTKVDGLVTATADVRTEVTEGALNEFLYEIRRINEEKVSEIELSDAKRSIIGGFALSLENQNSLLANIVQQEIYDFPKNYWDQYPQKISAVTVEDVQGAAQKYFNPMSLQIVAVGDAAKIRAVLAKFGAIEVFDANGKSLSSPTK